MSRRTGIEEHEIERRLEYLEESRFPVAIHVLYLDPHLDLPLEHLHDTGHARYAHPGPEVVPPLLQREGQGGYEAGG